MLFSEKNLLATRNEPNSSHSLLAWFICLIGSLFFFYEFIQMNMFNAISAELMQSFSLNATQLGKLSATYFYATVLFLLPAGQILDRFSTRRIMLLTLAVCVIGTAVFATSHSLTIVAISRFFTGIGSAFCFLSCIRLASRWFPAKRMALISGLVVTMAMAGGMAAQTPLTLLVEHLGWRQALLVDVALGVLIWLLIALVVRDYPPQSNELQLKNKHTLREIGYWRSMRQSYGHLQNWLCGIYTSLLNLPIFVLGGFMGSYYLEKTHSLSTTQASYVTSMLFLGTIIGAPVMGWLSDLIRLRRLPMLVGALLSLLLMLSIMYWPNWHFVGLLIAFLALGFITSTQVISYPLVNESNSSLLTATSVSVVSFCALSGGAVFNPFFGWLLDLHAKNNGVLQVTPNYIAADFHFALWVFPIVFIIALLAACFLKETHCLPLWTNKKG